LYARCGKSGAVLWNTYLPAALLGETRQEIGAGFFLMESYRMRMLITLMTATLFTTAAMANGPSGDGDKDRSKQAAEAKFESLDRNSDGRVSKNEAQSEDMLSAQFAAVDADSDGYVTESEYTAMADTKESRTDDRSPDYDRDPL
jgi:hypothetical protein